MNVPHTCPVCQGSGQRFPVWGEVSVGNERVPCTACRSTGIVWERREPIQDEALVAPSSSFSDDEQLVADLHDDVEEGLHTLREIEDDWGISEHVLEALDAISRREGETYMDYIQRCGANPLARRVKIADLEDHLDPAQAATLKPSLRTRYKRALAYLVTRSEEKAR